MLNFDHFFLRILFIYYFYYSQNISNLTKLEFVALDISGNNYLSWILDAELHFNASNLGEIIKANNSASLQDHAKCIPEALIFLRHHLDESLKNEYLTIKDPLVLWQSLQDRYDHQKISLMRICSKKKTFTTFHASNMLLQQQYRERRFTKYYELIACLLVAKKNNEFLLPNHQSRPIGFKAFPEANATFASPHSNRQGHKNGPSRGKGRERGGGRGRGRGDNSRNRNNGPFKNTKSNSNNGKLSNPQATTGQSITQRQLDNTCYRYSMTGHWLRTCRTAKHLFKDPTRNISHLICDGHVNFD